MSTRCQAKVVFEDGRTMDFYRHYNGGFSDAGETIHELLECSVNAESFVFGIIDVMTGFELTVSNHADIDYFYLIDFCADTFLGWQVDFCDGNTWRNCSGNKCKVLKNTQVCLIGKKWELEDD